MATRTQLDVESFYHLSNVDLSRAKCQGLACFVAQCGGIRRAAGWPAVATCLLSRKVLCRPTAGSDTSLPIIEAHSRRPVVLESIVQGGALSMEAYIAHGGVTALRKALALL